MDGARSSTRSVLKNPRNGQCCLWIVPRSSLTVSTHRHRDSTMVSLAILQCGRSEYGEVLPGNLHDVAFTHTSFLSMAGAPSSSNDLYRTTMLRGTKSLPHTIWRHHNLPSFQQCHTHATLCLCCLHARGPHRPLPPLRTPRSRSKRRVCTSSRQWCGDVHTPIALWVVCAIRYVRHHLVVAGQLMMLQG